MSALAFIDENNIVTHVILADPSFDPNGIPCSIKVCPGFVYHNEMFYPRQPYASWTMDEAEPKWNPPTPMPELDSDGDTTQWVWDEDTTSWVSV